MEAYLSKLKQRPDVLVSRKDKPDLAVEFQCAPLSYHKLCERSSGYERQGLSFFWFLGKNYRLGTKMTAKVAQFLKWSATRGFYLIYVDVAKKRIEVDYQLQMFDFLPLKYLRWYTTDIWQLRMFFKNHSLPTTTMVLPHERLHQLHVLKKMRYYSRGEMYKLQRNVYVKQAKLADIIDNCLGTTSYSPIYSKPLFWWYAQQVLFSEKIVVDEMIQRYCYPVAFLRHERFILHDVCHFFLK